MIRRVALVLFPLFFIMFFLHVYEIFLPLTKVKKTNKKPAKVVVRKIVKTPVINKILNTNTVVVIDPDDSLESKKNLSFAFQIARALRMKGVKVFFTRTGNYKVGIEGRFEKAFEYGADLFLTVACKTDEMEMYSVNNTYDLYSYSSSEKNKNTRKIEERISDFLIRGNLESYNDENLLLYSDIPSLILFMSYDSIQGKEFEVLAKKISSAIDNGLTRKLGVDIGKNSY